MSGTPGTKADNKMADNKKADKTNSVWITETGFSEADRRKAKKSYVEKT